jgi:hypothetical protein
MEKSATADSPISPQHDQEADLRHSVRYKAREVGRALACQMTCPDYSTIVIRCPEEICFCLRHQPHAIIPGRLVRRTTHIKIVGRNANGIGDGENIGESVDRVAMAEDGQEERVSDRQITSPPSAFS